jgi:DNA mismatch repair protein MutS
MPAAVIKRAKKVLAGLERDGDLRERLKGGEAGQGQPDLFSRGGDPKLEALAAEIEALDVNALTPIAALAKLNELKRKLE